MRRKDAEIRIEGHRKAIQEHIEKSEKYLLDYEKEEALRTIRRAQEEIANLKRRSSGYISDSYLDTWKPRRRSMDEIIYLKIVREELEEIKNNLLEKSEQDLNDQFIR